MFLLPLLASFAGYDLLGHSEVPQLEAVLLRSPRSELDHAPGELVTSDDRGLHVARDSFSIT